MTDIDALRALPDRLRMLCQSAKVHAGGGAGGQQCGLQLMRIVANGIELSVMYDAADELDKVPALLDELAAARRDAEDIRRAGEILADAPGLPLELLDEKELSKWTDAITGLVILFTDAIDAARGER